MVKKTPLASVQDSIGMNHIGSVLWLGCVCGVLTVAQVSYGFCHGLMVVSMPSSFESDMSAVLVVARNIENNRLVSKLERFKTISHHMSSLYCRVCCSAPRV